MKEGKPFEISKHQVLKAYKRVKANRGAGGTDGINFAEYEADLKNNLYKLWNRMSSGSYFPAPVRGVEIPKKNGKKRLLGIPTISDRIAQMVVRMNFEPLVEPIFCNDSYGYRPNRSALDAIKVARRRCWDMAWVIETDIRGLFDNIDHELLMTVVRKHTDCKWVALYIERFLKAPIMMPDGTMQDRTSGTPQGGVISPVLANLFMHYVFDRWMEIKFPQNPWERYADDALIHCQTEEEAKMVLGRLKERMNRCKLELHPEKTRIVYCRSDVNPEHYEHESFDFLGYTFRRRLLRSKYGNYFNGFTPAVSKSAGQSLRDKMRDIRKRHKTVSPEELANMMNPVIRGWSNYFFKISKGEARKALNFVNLTLVQWLRSKSKSTGRRYMKASSILGRMAKQSPDLFYHWRLGIYPTVG
jgi:RNA-directed DNA polymerase